MLNFVLRFDEINKFGLASCSQHAFFYLPPPTYVRALLFLNVTQLILTLHHTAITILNGDISDLLRG